MLFPQNITVEVQGVNVRGLNPDERTMALCLQRTLLIGGQDDIKAAQRREEELTRLQEKIPPQLAIPNPNKPGSLPKSAKNNFRAVRLARQSMMRRIQFLEAPAGFLFHRHETLEARLGEFSATGPVLMMSENGNALPDTSGWFAESITIILGNQGGYAVGDERAMMESCRVCQVSLGPRALLTSQCITITHHLLDEST